MRRLALFLLRLSRFVTPLLVVILPASVAILTPATAGARAYTPPGMAIFAGVSDQSISTYTAATGKHPAVYQEFIGLRLLTAVNSLRL